MKIPRPVFSWAVGALVVAAWSVTVRANCGCSMDRIAAQGTTMSPEGLRGPCGQLMSAAKAVRVQSAAAAPAAVGEPQGVISSSEELARATTKQIGIYSNFFDDPSSTITAGDAVKWTLVNGFHTVTSDTGLFDSGALFNIGDTFSVTFNTPGTYGYYCQFHGVPGGLMFGTVNVVAAPEPVAMTLALPAMLLAVRPVRRRDRAKR
jgi:plastocyanin